MVAVERVGEPDGVCGVVDYDVVDAVEFAAVEVVEYDFAFAGFGVDED